MDEEQQDIERIVRVVKEHGYDTSQSRAKELWEDYSNDFYMAGWLTLPVEDENVFRALVRVFFKDK